jgi:hypothetical protein
MQYSPAHKKYYKNPQSRASLLTFDSVTGVFPNFTPLTGAGETVRISGLNITSK